MPQPIAQLVPSAGTSSTLNQSQSNPWAIERDLRDGMGTMSAITRLFNRFDGIYMSKWKSNFPSDFAVDNWKDSWSQGLTRNGITIRMAFDGVQKCESEFKWPPSLPEFLDLCRVPFDFEQAFHDANRKLRSRHGDGSDIWPVPAIYWAALDFGQYELRNASYKQAEARWVRLLTKRMESECEPVPMFVPALAAPARNEQGEAITLGEAQTAAYKAMAALAMRKPSPQLAIERAKDTLAKFAAGAAVTPFQVAHAREVIARLGAGEADED